MNRASDVVRLINLSSFQALAEGIPAADLYLIASQRSSLPELHAVFHPLKPAGSKLKEASQWKNLQTALYADCAADGVLELEVAKKYVKHIVNFGSKHLWIDQLDKPSWCETVSKFDLDKLAIEELIIDGKMVLDDESTQAAETPIVVVDAFRDSQNNAHFLLFERIITSYYTAPPEGFLSPAGQSFLSDMRLRKRVSTACFHKVSFSEDGSLRVIMIDPRSLAGSASGSRSTSSTAGSDKIPIVLSAIRALVMPGAGKVDDKKKAVTFFPAIEKLYKDGSVGVVRGGYFITSSGARYTNDSRGSGGDLRKDPFQKGGELSGHEAPQFIKLSIEWPDLEGHPKINLNGSFEMIDYPLAGLFSVEVGFSTSSDAPAEFLLKVLDCAVWKEK
jgi:hypothetical protein